MRAKPFLLALLAVTVAAMGAVVVAEKTSHYTVSDQVNAAAPVQTQQTIRINAPPDKVWALLTDVNHWADWQKDIGNPRMSGAFEAGNSFDWESGCLHIHSTVGVAEPLKRIVWSGPAFGSFAIHTWTLTAHDGITEVQAWKAGWSA